jgi:CTP synthase (UTP-ammonia lyase)
MTERKFFDKLRMSGNNMSTPDKVVVPSPFQKRGIKGNLKSISFSLYEREKSI